MKEQNEELNRLENEILDTGLKTQTIKEQNDKFVNAIEAIQLEFKSLESEKGQNEMDQDQLQTEYNRLNRKRLLLYLLFVVGSLLIYAY